MNVYSPIQVSALVLAAYLIGSIPFGLLVARTRGIDIRSHGSGNVGATNVGRVLGRKWGILVFILDAGKGALVAITAGILTGPYKNSGGMERDLVWLAAGIACIGGSVAPVYLRFRGGKGVATSIGTVCGIYPYLTWPAVVVMVVWVLVVRLSRFVSLASLAAACTLPLAFVASARIANWRVSEHLPLGGLTILIAALVLFRHRENIRRLIAGTENRVRNPGSASPPEPGAAP